MYIGLNTDSLAALPLDQMLDATARLGIEYVELPTGNWSDAPHLDLDDLLANAQSRKELAKKVEDRGLKIDALNCSGNPLHPGQKGEEHKEVTHKTFELANELGVRRIILMSGCPAAGPEDNYPNWITVAWPPYTLELLDWQWNEVLLPYWSGLVAEAHKYGITELCVEMHGHQNVYSPATLLKLRDAVGPTVGANFDPSHLVWMGADVLAAVEALEGAIYHVHAKDTKIERSKIGLNTALDTVPYDHPKDRSWNYVTLGYGQDESFWSAFMITLRRAGFDGILSVEHEDMLVDPIEALDKTVSLLNRVSFMEPIAQSEADDRPGSDDKAVVRR
jgi:sugar phosphate isomerase/epimerase